jgi:hypothetical protein
MDTIYIISIVLVGIIGGSYLIGYLMEKGIIKSGFSQNLIDSAKLAEIILEVVPIPDETKEKSKRILDIASTVSDYIYNLENDVVDKSKLSLDVVNEILVKLGITPTENEEKMIKYVVEESLKWLENKEKVSS